MSNVGRIALECQLLEKKLQFLLFIAAFCFFEVLSSTTFHNILMLL